MIHTQTETRVQLLVGLKDTAETNGQTDGRKDATDCFTFSVTVITKPS